MTEFAYFKSERGQGAGTKMEYKGSVAGNYIEAMRSDDDDVVAEALGTLSGEGIYIVVPMETLRTVEVVAKRAFQAKRSEL